MAHGVQGPMPWAWGSDKDRCFVLLLVAQVCESG